MINSTIANDRTRREVAATETFLESPSDESFTELFRMFTPQLVSFFRSHGCRPGYLRLGVTCFTGITGSNSMKRPQLTWRA